jgi:hypothetical protein
LAEHRPNFTDPGGHAIAMGVFGVVGYYAHQWDLRAAEIIAESKRDIEERRRNQIARAEQRSAEQLAEA